MGMRAITSSGIIKNPDIPEVMEVIKNGESVWIDLTSPSEAEISTLSRIIPIHPLNLEDCLPNEELPKVDEFLEYTFLLIYGIDRSDGDINAKELDILISKNILITVHHVYHNSIEYVWKICEKEPAILKEGSDNIAYRIIDGIIDRIIPIMDFIDERIDGLEDKIIEESTEGVVEEILCLKRNILHLRRLLNPQRDVIYKLSRHENPYINSKVRIYFTDIHDHIYRLYEELESMRDISSSLLEAHRSNMSLKMNKVMQKLTIIATIFMPLTFIVGLYGMNFENMPELKIPWAYPAVLIFMFILSIGLYIYFKIKDWF